MFHNMALICPLPGHTKMPLPSSAYNPASLSPLLFLQNYSVKKPGVDLRLGELSVPEPSDLDVLGGLGAQIGI